LCLTKEQNNGLTYTQGLRESLMSRLLTTPVENVEWSRYLREMSEKEQYNSGVIVKLTGELEAAEQLKDADVRPTVHYSFCFVHLLHVRLSSYMTLLGNFLTWPK